MSEIGRRFSEYLKSMPGERDPNHTGPDYLNVPEPFFPLPETDQNYARQRESVRRLDRVLILAEIFAEQAMDANPSVDPFKVIKWALERALEKVKEEGEK